MAVTNFTINGKLYSVNLSTLPPDITLNTFIREHAQLTGTKNMCLEGGCGACVCVIKGKHAATGEMKTWAANSCLTLLNTCADWEIITSEGIGNGRTGYHPIQKRLAKMNGSQCGYCSPGMVMNMYGLWEAKEGQLTMDEIENSFGGNICRCTGYRPILDAMKSFAVDSNIAIPAECEGDIEDLAKRTCPKTGETCAGTCHAFGLKTLDYDDGSSWHWPKTFDELFKALNDLGNAEFMFVAGNTGHGVYRRSLKIKHFINVNAIPELKKYSIDNNQLVLGGNLSLTEAMDIFKEAAKRPGYEYCDQLWNHFDLIANVPVRNMGTLAGNITLKRQNSEFPSDIFLTFECLNVQVLVRENANSQKTISLMESINSKNNKLVIEAFILKPYDNNQFVFGSYKIMPRAQNAHAYVNAAFLVEMNRASGITKSGRICFGGIHPEFVHATNIESVLASNANLFTKETVGSIFNQLMKDLQPDEVLPDASSEYRKNLACGLLYKFLLHIAGESKVRKEFISGAEILKRPLSSGVQTFDTQKKNYPITQPVNKIEVDLNQLPADINLNTFIRTHAGLTGTKFMCQEGGCGVCVCVVTGKHPVTGEISTWALNSCLTPLHSCVDWTIFTTEGLGSKRDGYHIIQERLAKMNGTQCGYCSPGFVMNMYGLLKSKGGKVTMQEVENAFGGNTCRCTGYRPILDAMKSFAIDSNIEIPAECQRDIEDLAPRSCPKTGQSCSGACQVNTKKSTSFKHPDGTEWFWPITIEDISSIFNIIGGKKYMFLAGNTAHGVYRRPTDIQVYIDVKGVSELKKYEVSADRLVLGANMSLNETIEVFEKVANTAGFEYCAKLKEHFELIANMPVRNMGTLAGNLMIKHDHNEFPSDVFITLETLGAAVLLISNNETRTISVEEFIKSPMEKTLMKAIVLKPYPKERFVFESYKIMSVAQNVHAYVNAGILLEINKSTLLVKSARVCFGGIHEEFVHAENIENYLIGKSLLDEQVVSNIFEVMKKSVKAESVLPEASTTYKEKLAMGLIYKFLLNIAPQRLVKEEYLSGGLKLTRAVSSGKQTFDTITGNYPIALPTDKLEGLRQTSGEIMYSNDVANQQNQLWAAFVTATKVGAQVTHVDLSAALNLPGVVGYLTAKDIPGENNVVIVPDYMQLFHEVEPLFEIDNIRYHSQPVGLIVANSNALAQRAANLVKLTYSNTDREVYPTTKKVLEHGAKERLCHTAVSPLAKMNFQSGFEVHGKGEIEMGLQFHFYMEPQTTVVIPCETGFEVHSATQWTDMMQSSIAKLLNLKTNEVQVYTRRLGGGYGGKATRSLPVGCAAALAAYHFKRPVRFVQSIESMMSMLGKRAPCTAHYEFYAKKSGKIMGINNEFYQDSGYLANESPIPLTVIGAVNCYDLHDVYKLDGYRVRCDAPANTACRAPGSLETVAMTENIMEHVAFMLNVDPLEVRKENIKPEHKLGQMIRHFEQSTEYYKRRREVNEFNEKNRWRKKGLGLSMLEYRIDYFGQYPITLAAYHNDGSVVITHGGVEMGQGMNTKIAQVTAHDLGIEMENIKFESSNTINGANTTVTGGSLGSEVLCFAVRKCCKTLNERLAPVKNCMKNPSWQELLEAAFRQNINLIVSDNVEQSELVNYAVNGISLTEVEVDILTGNYLLTRVDILEDVGESLNPNVDVGQVEGAFVMGLGYWTSEQVVVDENTGEIKTNRTWNYKPPGAKDIPIDFRVEFLSKSQNAAGFMRSKATGEPAICMSISAAFALHDAIYSARKDPGLQREWIPICNPITPERVVLLAGSEIDHFKLN